MSKSHLRKTLRQKRRSLSSLQQQIAARKLATVFALSAEFQKARSIALYLANDGEISLSPLLMLALKHRKTCYLPSLKKTGEMLFRQYSGPRKLIRNHYNIQEPFPQSPPCSANKIDLVILPLVGFDRSGNRLGMGGGYYDRTFAFQKHFNNTTQILIGAAHACQEVDKLQAESWDIPLQHIATDAGMIKVVGKKKKNRTWK